MTIRVLVTGATGFIGRRLTSHLIERGFTVRAAVRNAAKDRSRLPPEVVDIVEIGDISSAVDWSRALADVDAVVHLAGYAHSHAHGADAQAINRKINYEATATLVENAIAAGVKRFVYVSSMGVNGAVSAERSFRETDIPAPVSPYARAKWEAERALWRLSAGSTMECCVVRPPLVYGENAGGNFRRLVLAIRLNIPLPLATVKNLRSFIAMENLCDFLGLCLTHPGAGGQTFLVADDEDVSTSEFVRRIGIALGKRPRLFPCSMRLFALSTRWLNRPSFTDGLFASMTADVSFARRRLGWKPPLALDEGLRSAVAQYRRHRP